MPESTPLQPASSPTGTPRMHPERVPLWLVLGVGLAAGFTAAGQLLPEQYALARVICTVLGIAVGSCVGIVSPGLRSQGGKMLVLLAAGLSLTGCATFQQPPPVGQPGPVACFTAKETERAWLKYVAPAVEKGLAAQVVYSCGQPAPAEPPPAFNLSPAP